MIADHSLFLVATCAVGLGPLQLFVAATQEVRRDSWGYHLHQILSCLVKKIARRARALAAIVPCPERLAEHMSKEGGLLDGCSLREKLLVRQSQLPAWNERVYMLTWPLLGA